MGKDKIEVKVSRKILKLVPDLLIEQFNQNNNRENELEVLVTNQSNYFTSFQAELKVVGFEVSSELEWYRVEPKLCSKKPPGDKTQFQIAIIKPPIPTYNTRIELILKVYSVENTNLFTEKNLSLTIQKPRKSLKIYLPIKDFSITPGETFKIPVLVYNLSSKANTISINLSGIDLSWLTFGSKIELRIEPGDSEEISFTCYVPQTINILSQTYNFAITAKSIDSGYNPPIHRGTIEILPLGVVKINCDKSELTIPQKPSKFWQRKNNFVIYNLKLLNSSNLKQQIDFKLAKEDKSKCEVKPPKSIIIEPGEVEKADILVQKNRHWLGGDKKLSIKLLPQLSHSQYTTEALENRIVADPNIQFLELIIKPKISLLFQWLGGITGLFLLWLLWLFNPVGHHRGAVNSIRIIGNGGTIISGSSDRSIRRWQVNSSPWGIFTRRLKYEGTIAEETGKAVRVIRQSPQDDDVIASGLENGDIDLWNILFRERQSTVEESNDRVFDLDFSSDSRYLFSVHGSGFIYQWNLFTRQQKLGKQVYLNSALNAIAISEQKNQPTLIVVGGRYGKLYVWDWQNGKLYEIKYELPANQDFRPHGGQNHYITSLAIGDKKSILVMADNQGYITLWNFEGLRQCISDYSQNDKIRSSNINADGKITRKKTIECNQSIIDQWQNGHDRQPIRSVAITNNSCYFASTGDDGKVILWILDEEGKRVEQTGKIIAEFNNTKLNTVDIKALKNTILVASDAKNYRIKIYRINQEKIDAECS